MRDLRNRVLASTLAVFIGAGAGIPSALADDIARWVDDKGVTHFSNTGLAPTDAQRLEVGRTNGMEAPVAPTKEFRRGSRNGNWTKLTLPEKKNKKGWRPRRESLYTGRKHVSRY